MSKTSKTPEQEAIEDEEWERDLERSAADFHARNGSSEKIEVDRIVFDGEYYMAWGADPSVSRPSDAWLDETARRLWPIVGNGRFRVANVSMELTGADRWQVAWIPVF